MLRILLLLALAPLLMGQETPAAGNQHSIPKSEIKSVLVLARDAALEQERAEDGTQGGWLPQHLQTLMAAFRTIDDWQDAVTLQKRVNKFHKVDVLYAPPHATIADYRKLRQSAEKLEKYDRDNGLERIISQELTDGFLEDAERVAGSISDARIQSDAYTDIAVFSWQQKKKDVANRNFQAAIDAAFKIQTGFGEVDTIQRQAGQLSSIAQQRNQAGDKPGALDILTRLHAMLVSSEGYLHDSLCGTFGHTQADLGLFEEAHRSATCFAKEEDRNSAEQEFSYQEITESESADAIAKALGVAEVGRRIGLLSEMGFSQAEAGNKADALIALDEAMKAFPSLHPPDYPPHGPAYTLRRIAVGYLEAGARDKGEAALTQLRGLKDATASTRDQYDFLYDLAVGYASFALYEEAHGFVDEMGQYPNEQACNVVAYLQAKQGQADQAVAWATQLKDPGARTAALVGVVEAMLEINEEVARQMAH